MALSRVVRAEELEHVLFPDLLGVFRLRGRRVEVRPVGSPAAHVDVAERDVAKGVEGALAQVHNVHVVPLGPLVPIAARNIRQHRLAVDEVVPRVVPVREHGLPRPRQVPRGPVHELVASGVHLQKASDVKGRRQIPKPAHTPRAVAVESVLEPGPVHGDEAGVPRDASWPLADDSREADHGVAGEAADSRVACEVVVHVGDVEGRGGAVGRDHGPSEVVGIEHGVRRLPVEVEEVADGVHVRAEVEGDLVALLDARLHVEHVRNHVVRHVARHLRVKRPVHHKPAEVALVHRAVRHEGPVAVLAEQVQVHGVPPDLVRLPHSVKLCRCDARGRVLHDDEVAAVAGEVVSVARHLGEFGTRARRSSGLRIRRGRVFRGSLDEDVAGEEAYFCLVLLARGVVGVCERLAERDFPEVVTGHPILQIVDRLARHGGDGDFLVLVVPTPVDSVCCGYYQFGVHWPVDAFLEVELGGGRGCGCG
mmetsp:Transcript_10775/g.21605  ORF Transcript_10775/g.21605 Transcript_10775/m.21605 type:complete len:479 (+) Transcript_10775:1094-2530(+)